MGWMLMPFAILRGLTPERNVHVQSTAFCAVGTTVASSRHAASEFFGGHRLCRVAEVQYGLTPSVASMKADSANEQPSLHVPMGDPYVACTRRAS